jgi:hypothetical protein
VHYAAKSKREVSLDVDRRNHLTHRQFGNRGERMRVQVERRGFPFWTMVPLVLPSASSTSPSPVNVPLVIETVAPARSRLSESDTETLPDNVTAA